MSLAIAQPWNSAADFCGLGFRVDQGESDESRSVWQQMVNYRRDVCMPFTRNLKFNDAEASLINIFRACNEEGWDGYDALVISQEAISEASKLISLMPSFIPVPDVSPEPDGGIALEWFKDQQHTFVASVSGQRAINYAGIFGALGETYGVEYFEDSIPYVVIENIKRLLL